ncbi:MAG TPA: hypothetical protein VF008_01985 [Niastella sp.]
MNIAEKLERIEALKGKIDQLMPPKDWDDAFFRKVKLDFTYNSNKLEGNTLTYGQTIKLLRDFVAPKDAASTNALNFRTTI